VYADSLHIQGNHFVQNGNIVTLRGASNWELEFGCNANGHYQPSDMAAMKTWGMNAVRFNLNSTSWLVGANGCSSAEYQNEVKKAVTNAKNVGMYAILDLQWLAPNSGENEPMAYPQDATFWQQVSQTYGNDANVGFVPVTEPHDVTYDQWYNRWHGGPGMKQLVSIIRNNAPTNIIFVNGLNWANDLSFLGNQYAITGSNIAYEVHIYDNFTANIDQYINNFAIDAGEFGIQSSTDLVPQTLNYFESHHTGYFAWSWTTSVDGSVKYLLNDWNGTPKQNNYGNIVHDFMVAHVAGGILPTVPQAGDFH
jgi:hypothetical protein